MYKKIFLRALFLFNLTLLAQPTFASFEWHGRYSFGANYLSNANVSENGLSKRYATHHLTLLPELVPADYFKIHARLDIFNENGLTSANQVGSLFGGTSTAPENSGMSNSLDSDFVAVNELYLTWSKENALLAVGRVPYSFGLGMFHNAGRGLFDHWFTNKDMVMGQVSMGPFVVRPMIAKSNEMSLSTDDSDIDEYLLEFEFNVPDSETQIALLYSLKTGDGATSLAPSFLDASAIASGDFKLTQYGLFVNKKWGNLGLGLEVNILDGDTGYTVSGKKVSIDSFGAAMELNWKSKDSPWKFSFKSGYASGDDSTSTDSFEGFAFHPNYNIGLILFNHPLGANGVDVLGTDSYRSATNKADALDEERISNAIYFAPSLAYKFSNKYQLSTALVSAMLVEKNLQAKSSLGVELDLAFTFKPFERMSWVTEAGYLLTGEGFQPTTLDRKDTYIIKTKAAISF